MMKLDHIGIAVEDLEAAVAHFGLLLGAPPSHRETVAAEQVDTAFFDAGDASVELLGATGSESAIASFIAKRGEGIHHMAFHVDDLDAQIERLRAAGFRFLSDEPREGAGGKRIIFMHPKEHHGVLIELCQRNH